MVLELLREEMTLNELAAKYQISPVVISRWKTEFLARAGEVFKKGPSDAEKEVEEKEETIADLHRMVGQLTVEVDFLKKKIWRNSPPKGNVWPQLIVSILT